MREDNFEKAKQLFIQGLEYLKHRDLESAKNVLIKSLELAPGRESTQNNLSVVYTEQANQMAEANDFEEAVNLYKLAIKYNEQNAMSWCNLGAIYFDHLDNPMMAIECLYKAIEINNNYPEAHFNLSNTLIEINNYSEALYHLNQALALNSHFAEAWLNKGIVLNHQKSFEDALTCFKTCLSINHNWCEAWVNKGASLSYLKRYKEALIAYDQAIKIDPSNANAWSNKGACLFELLDYENALLHYTKATEISPEIDTYWFNKGACLYSLNKHISAIENYDKCLAINPKNLQAIINKSAALNELGQFEEAIDLYEEAQKLNSDMDFSFGDDLNRRMSICKWDHFDEKIKMVKEHIDKGKPIIQPLHLLAAIDSPQIQLECSRIFLNKKYPGKIISTQKNQNGNKNKIKLAYISPDFGNHPITHLLSEIIESHNRENFEVHGIYFGSNTRDAFFTRISKAFDYFHDISSLPETESIEFVKGLEIDIAIDLAGYTRNSRIYLFSSKCAPIQVNFLGYPGSMGAEFIDYLIADKVVIPEENLDFYSENVIYMPHCFQPNDSKRQILNNKLSRTSAGLPENKFIFCCFNNSFKLNPSMVDKWAKVLHEVENSIIWILAENQLTQKNLLKEFNKKNIPESRIFFAGRTSHADYLARYKLADLFLDTLPFNAGTTASDALWAELPVLTQTGNSFAGRMATSLLKNLKLDELITQTDEEYVNRAIEIAKNLDLHKRLKNRLKEMRSSSHLFNGKKYTNDLEKVLTKLHNWDINKKFPKTIEI